MGIFSGIGNVIRKKQEDIRIRKAEEKEEELALNKARHEARMRSAPQIAEMEEQRYMQNIRYGKASQGKSMFDKLADMGANVNANLERGRGFDFGGGNFGGGFGEIDLQRAAGFGSSRPEKQHRKKHKQNKPKQKGKT